MEDKFFSLEEVSRYLKISKSTLYKLSQRNKIPSLKIGKQLRFRKSSVDQWLVDKESEGSVSLNRKSLMIKTHAPALGLSSKKVLLIDDDEIVDQLVFFAGILYHMLDMFDKAEQMFGELLKYRENKKMRKTDVLYELGSVHLDMNKFEQAEGEMLALFKEYKNRNIPPPFFVLMGEIIQKQKRFDEAKYWYDRAIRYDKYDHEWYKKCALMLEECGRYKQALKYWNKIISLPKDRINETVCDSDRVIFKEKQYRDAVKFANIHREICEKHKEQR